MKLFDEYGWVIVAVSLLMLFAQFVRFLVGRF